MTKNQKILISLLLVVILSGGLFLATKGGNQASAGHTTAQGAQVTIDVHDQNDDPISGAAVEVINEAGAKVDSGITRADGQVIVNLGAAAGRYRVIMPDTPDGYVDHSDSDGAVARMPSCDNLHRCIRYLVNAQGTVTVSDDVNADSGLGWFEFTRLTSSIGEEQTFVDPEQSDELIEQPSGGTTSGADSDESDSDDAGSDAEDESTEGADTEDAGTEDTDEATANEPATGKLRCHVRHGRGASNIGARLEAMGGGRNVQDRLEGATVTVTGESMNNGEPVSAPMNSGVAETTSGIVSYGPHPMNVEVHSADGQLLGQTSVTPEVDSTEGELPGCDAEFELAVPGSDSQPANDESSSAPASDDTAEVSEEAEMAEVPEERVAQASPVSDEERIHAFAAMFSAAHDAQDSQALLGSLHPTMQLMFGFEACLFHVEDTTGGVTQVTILEIGPEQTLEVDGFAIESVRPVVFGWTETATGEATTASGFVAVTEDGVFWLGNCGQNPG